MYYINLDTIGRAGITYSNVSDYSIIPMLKNDTIGYNGKTPIPVHLAHPR